MPQETKTTPKKLSVVVPVYNEEESLPAFFSELMAVLSGAPLAWEVVVVDDGSNDGSYAVLAEQAARDSHVRVVRLRTNFGQTAALAAGIEHAEGDVIVTIDSDLENDPQDIPRLLTKLDEGYDVVSGWRQGRWRGAFFTRRLPSMVANWLISTLTKVHLHDYGCTLKAYRAEVIRGVKLYGEMHRFVPAYAAWYGGRVAELPVAHRPRQFGKSKYGMGRVLRVLLDLVVVVFLHRFMNRPMHFFGTWGFWILALGVVGGVSLVTLRLFGMSAPFESYPILVALLILVGMQLVLFGVMAEMLMRTYYESQDKRPYVVIKETDTYIL